MPHLFEPLTIRGVTLRNRIGVSPMCQYSSVDGFASDWHLVHLGSRAVGGAALVIAEATAVEPRGRISPSDLGIWKDEHIAPLARAAKFIHEHGAVAGIQLAHAGRKGSTTEPYHPERDRQYRPDEGGWTPVAPSPVPFRPNDPPPHELSVAEIHEIRGYFEAATKRALQAGFKWLEFHAAHGYLAHEFLSPLANKRTDQYGGSYENRTRFVVETATAMRSLWPAELPMSVRISVKDWVPRGWDIEDSVALAKLLKKVGVDLIDCSSGAMVPGVKYPAAPGWQAPLAAAVRKGAEIATAAVGMISQPEHANELIKSEQADIVLLGTEMLRDPYWAFHAALALGHKEAIRLPKAYDYVLRR